MLGILLHLLGSRLAKFGFSAAITLVSVADKARNMILTFELMVT